MRIAVVYGNDGSDVRIAKTCTTLAKLGHEVHFIGWNRRPDVEKVTDIPGTVTHIVDHLVPHLGSTFSGQAAFTRHAIRTLWKLKPEAVHAVNEDNILRIGWLKGMAFRTLVCDVFDSQIDRQSQRAWPVRAVVTGLVQGTRWWCDRLIATDDVRFETFGWARAKTTVIGNYPADPGPALASAFPVGPPKVFVSGTLARDRGTEQLLRAVEQVPGCRIMAAGWAADDYTAKEFLGHPSVEFLGHLTPLRSLEVASECDALLALYAPHCRNHILASPNKIYDALSVGRPVIINSEALVSQWVTQQAVGFACPYSDAGALAGFLQTLLARRQQLAAYVSRARALFLSGYSWEAMEGRLAALYGSDAVTAAETRTPVVTGLSSGPTQRRAA